MDDKLAAALREPFPPAVIGKLPRGGITLDYVGHAATTDRLLHVDPAWTWEPLALDEVGLPAIDAAGNLWIRLTVAGVTRIGVGDGKNMKERIGDAIRNAAMRFGVALDLWAKEDLWAMGEESGPSSEPEPEPQTRTMSRSKSAPESPMLNTASALAKRMFAALGQAGITDKANRLDYVSSVVGRTVESSTQMTDADAEAVIDALAKLAASEVPDPHDGSDPWVEPDSDERTKP